MNGMITFLTVETALHKHKSEKHEKDDVMDDNSL